MDELALYLGRIRVSGIRGFFGVGEIKGLWALGLGILLIAWPGEIGAQSGKSRIQYPPSAPKKQFAPDPKSAAFLPLRLTLAANAGIPAFRHALSQIAEDSNTFFEEKNGRFELSHEMVEKLSAKLSGPTRSQSWRGWRGRLAQGLSQWTGVTIHAGDPAHAAYLPNDPWLQGSPQWALANPGTTIANIPGKAGYDIQMLPVWDSFGGDDSLVVAVIDAGFNFKHPDLRRSWFVNEAESRGLPAVDDDNNGFVDDSAGWDFVEGDADPSDYNGHGTEVASVMVANFDNGVGISGMLPEGKVLPLRALDASGHGDQADIAAAIQYAVKMKVDAINFSIGGNVDNQALKNAFIAARDAGIPVVVAAGNEGRNLDLSPPAPMSYGYDNIISVAAVNHGGQFCKFSNYGVKTVDIAAPGEYVLTCGVADRIEIWQDTFEVDLSHWTATNAGDFALTAADPLQGGQSVQWKAGSNAALTLNDFIDLRGKVGGSLWMAIDFTPANSNDAFLIEALREGESKWLTLGALGGGRIEPSISLGLNGLDGHRFKLRLRTYLTLGSSSARKLRFDQVYISSLNPDPADPAPYPVVAGTSIAAPHVTAYAALVKIACERMGLPFTKEKVLAGAVADTACEGKIRSGGRLDVRKGLEFYLKTLPTLRIEDSTITQWAQGKRVEYTLGLSDAAADGWDLGTETLPFGGAFDSVSGKLLWQDGISETGPVQLRLKARGPTTLRKAWSFSIMTESPTALRFFPRQGRSSSAPGTRALIFPALGPWGHLDLLGRHPRVFSKPPLQIP